MQDHNSTGGGRISTLSHMENCAEKTYNCLAAVSFRTSLARAFFPFSVRTNSGQEELFAVIERQAGPLCQFCVVHYFSSKYMQCFYFANSLSLFICIYWAIKEKMLVCCNPSYLSF